MSTDSTSALTAAERQKEIAEIRKRFAGVEHFGEPHWVFSGVAFLLEECDRMQREIERLSTPDYVHYEDDEQLMAVEHLQDVAEDWASGEVHVVTCFRELPAQYLAAIPDEMDDDGDGQPVVLGCRAALFETHEQAIVEIADALKRLSSGDQET